MNVSNLTQHQKMELVKTWQQGNALTTMHRAIAFGVTFSMGCGSCILAGIDTWIRELIEKQELQKP